MKKTLFSGIGSHATSVIQSLHTHSADTIYIIYNKTNTPKYDSKIYDLKKDIKDINEKMGNLISVFYIQIDKQNFFESYKHIIQLYIQERMNEIVTDITAGHKIISYLMYIAHTITTSMFSKKKSRIVYDYKQEVKKQTIPVIYFSFKRKELLYILDLYYADQQTMIIENEDNRFKPKIDIDGNPTPEKNEYEAANSTKLIRGENYTGITYSRPTVTRYNKKLCSLGILNDEYNFTDFGKCIGYISTIIPYPSLKNEL